MQPPKFGGKPKYFIDYENEIKECGDCHTKLPFGDYHRTIYDYPVTYCKKCVSKRSMQRYFKNKAKEILDFS